MIMGSQPVPLLILAHAQHEALKRCIKLMGMYINRVNGSWSERRRWSVPRVTPAADIAAWAASGSNDYSVYRADVL
jgi:hypothetical protein